MKNCGDNVFEGIPVGKTEAVLFNQYLDGQDFCRNTRRAVTQDAKKFARWFTQVNNEPFKMGRVTVRDFSDFRDYLRREKARPFLPSTAASSPYAVSWVGSLMRATFLQILGRRSRNFVKSSLLRRDLIAHRFAGCFEKSSCVRTYGPPPSSPSSCIRAAG